MTGDERRKKIIEILNDADKAVSGSQLSKVLGVSRQVIVQDIALLRAKDIMITSTTSGYVISERNKESIQRIFKVHHTDEEMEDELNTIVDLGGRILDVTIVHPIYNVIKVNLEITNRKMVKEFICKMKDQEGVPLKDMSDGTHMHTIEADSKDILDEIEEELRIKGFLIEVV